MLENRTISEFQTLMTTLYGSRDVQRGPEKSLLWLLSECGELLDAYLKGDSETLQEEVADVFAWLCSICNLLNIDLELAAWKKYPYKCPKCESSPCKCIPL